MTSSTQTCGNCEKCEKNYHIDEYLCDELNDFQSFDLIINNLDTYCFFNPSRWKKRK
jgi:hypothetical protein